MSWDIGLYDDHLQYCQVENFVEGGTFPSCGTTDATLNVTYNYGEYFDFKQLHKMRGRESIPILEEAVEKLGIERDEDYWNPTCGNVGYACSILLRWARQHPEGMWLVL